MTAAPQANSAWNAFTALLPDDIRPRLNYTRRIDYFLTVAIDQQHWTLEQLAGECARDLDTAANIGAVITQRLEIASTVPPPKPKPAKPGVIPFCDRIDHELTCAERRGFLVDNEGYPTERCPCRTEKAEVNA